MTLELRLTWTSHTAPSHRSMSPSPPLSSQLNLQGLHILICEHISILLASEAFSLAKPSPLPRWITNNVYWPHSYYLDSDISSHSSSCNLTLALEALINFIIMLVEASITRSTGNPEQNWVQWWTKEIYLAVKDWKKSYRFSKSTHYQADIIAYKTARTKARYLVYFTRK